MRFFNAYIQKKVTVAFLLMFSWIAGSGQEVKEENGTINSKKYAGYSVVIQDMEAKVSSFWKDYLIDLGKIRRKRDFLQVEAFSIPDAFYPEAIFYSRVIERDSTSRIWLALDPSTLLAGEGGESIVNEALQDFMSGLPVEYERFKVESQIAEARHVINFTERQKVNLSRESNNFQIKLVDAKAEKERLENTLENLELEILALNQKIENNKIAVTQAEADILKIQRMIEIYNHKLEEIDNR